MDPEPVGDKTQPVGPGGGWTFTREPDTRVIPTPDQHVVGMRVAAYLADVLLLAIPAYAIRVALGAVGIPVSAPPAILLAALLDLLYYPWWWTRPGGATPGMRLFGIGLETEDGAGLSARVALRRLVILSFVSSGIYLVGEIVTPASPISGAVEFASLAWFIALIGSTVTSPTRQGMHDRFAGTVVRRRVELGTARRLVAVVLVILGTFGFSWFLLRPLPGP